jgi:GDP-L-fucose synthase
VSPILGHTNVGCGQDIAIRELAETIGKVIGYMGEISLDSSKPDGPRVS